MISECANPQCATPFRYLTKGSILILKNRKQPVPATKHGDVEWFWLCERCSPWFEIWIQPSGQAECVRKAQFRFDVASGDLTGMSSPAA